MRKYAYNINNSFYGKNIKPENQKKFVRLTRAFYNDIENSDISINQKEKELRKIKNNSLKEFIFSNKQIPDKWKKKLTYQNDVIKILTKDNNLLYYIGRGGQSSIKKEDVNKMNLSYRVKKIYTKINKNINENIDKNRTINSNYRQLLPKINKSNILKNKKNLKQQIINNNKIINNNNKTIISEEEDSSVKESISNYNFPQKKLKINKNENLSNEEIDNILEELKIAYPIKIKNEEFFEEHAENEIKDNNLKKNNSNNLLFSKTFNLNSSLLDRNKGYNPFESNYKKKAKKKKEIRQNIFNNLISSKNKNSSKSMLNINSKKLILKKIKLNEEGEKLGQFLNLESEQFYKKIKINNPVIKKHLENINNYGPYYAYCPPCVNKNLNYYNHLEPNQCLKLIENIKKMKENNNNKKRGNNEPIVC